ncbi:MAG: PKD domain-containing protein, partial [Candidatus Aminicenantes bacterium]|nr:PKD domain-containing protein [Candidatus Aminicenantes bacterium]
MRRAVLSFAILAVLVGAAVLPARAKETVYRTSAEAWAPKVAADRNGRVHVVWMEVYSEGSGDCFYAVGANGQNFGSPVNLSGNGAGWAYNFEGCDIDVDSSNSVYVVWVERGALKLRVFDGSWSGTTTLYAGNSDLYYPGIAVDNGNIYVVFNTTGGDTMSRARVNGTWEETRYLAGGAFTKHAAIGLGSSSVYACWADKATGEYKTRYARRSKSLNAGWSAAAPIPTSDTGIEDQFPVIEGDSSDNAHCVWSYYLGGNRQIVIAHQAGGNWGAVDEVSDSEMLHYPRISEYNNILAVTWQAGGYGGGTGVRYNFWASAGYSGIGTVPDSGGVTFCDVSIQPASTKAYFVWDGSDGIWCGVVTVDTSGGGGGGGGGGNVAPVARFTMTPREGEVPLTVRFDGSASSDADGHIVSYAWDYGDAKFGTGAVTTHTYTTGGDFTARLTVVDDQGKTGWRIDTLRVLKPNIPPRADFNFSPTTGFYPLPVDFDGSLSSDEDGTIKSYEWSFGDGESAYTVRARHTFRFWGTFNVRLTVTDNRNGTSQKVKTIAVLRLFQPLDISWTTSVDEGLFRSRYVTDVRWQANPANDGIARIVAYRIWRKKKGEDILNYRSLGQVDAGTFFYRDTNVEGLNLDDYTVT